MWRDSFRAGMMTVRDSPTAGGTVSSAYRRGRRDPTSGGAAHARAGSTHQAVIRGSATGGDGVQVGFEGGQVPLEVVHRGFRERGGGAIRHHQGGHKRVGVPHDPGDDPAINHGVETEQHGHRSAGAHRGHEGADMLDQQDAEVLQLLGDFSRGEATRCRGAAEVLGGPDPDRPGFPAEGTQHFDHDINQQVILPFDEGSRDAP